MNEILILSNFTKEEISTIVADAVSCSMQSFQMNEREPNQYITVDEAAKLLSVSTVTIYDRMKVGELKKHKIGRGTRLLRSEVMALIERT